MTEGIQTFADYRQTYKAKLKTCLDVAYVVGDTSNWAYDDHKNSNVAIKICGYYSQYWYQNVGK